MPNGFALYLPQTSRGNKLCSRAAEFLRTGCMPRAVCWQASKMQTPKQEEGKMSGDDMLMLGFLTERRASAVHCRCRPSVQQSPPSRAVCSRQCSQARAAAMAVVPLNRWRILSWWTQRASHWSLGSCAPSHLEPAFTQRTCSGVQDAPSQNARQAAESTSACSLCCVAALETHEAA